MEKAQLRRALQIAAAVIVVLLAIGVYKAKTDAARTQAHVRQLETQIQDTEADLRALRAEIAERESPERVAALAKERLGLEAGAASTALPEGELAERLPPPQRANAGGR